MHRRVRLNIAKLRAIGYSQSEISEQLSISQQTISYQLKKLRLEADKVGPDYLFGALAAEHKYHTDIKNLDNNLDTTTKDDTISDMYIAINTQVQEIHKLYLDEIEKIERYSESLKVIKESVEVNKW